jgi:membrane-bound lytic murein transglycosylase A
MLFEALASHPLPAYNPTVARTINITEVAETTSVTSSARQRLCSLAVRLVSFLALAASAVIETGCARTAAPTPETAFRVAEQPHLSDDLAFSDLADAIELQRRFLNKKPERMMRFGPYQVSQGDYVQALDKLLPVLRSASSDADKLRYLAEHFEFLEIYGGDEWGQVLLTSYYEPIIDGSLKPTQRFSQPLYARPKDLLSVPLHPFGERFKDDNALRARVKGNEVIPYFSREEIDDKGALKGRHLEICFVDPIDAFFLQIQGSGTIRLHDGSLFHVTYADKNGHKYVPIGKFLKEKLAPKPVTMQRLIAALRAMPSPERSKLLNENPSYVFFQRSKQRAITSLGVSATPGRTVAADPKFAPKGALAFITFSKPVFSQGADRDAEPQRFTEAGRFVVDQDSGGAITGTGRMDLFWGRGDEARRSAGVMQDPAAHVWYLFPRYEAGPENY